MSRPLFVDTSALFACLSPREARHAEARSLYEAVRGDHRPLFSSTDVLNELVTLVRSRSDAEQAVRIGESLRNEGSIRFIPVNAAIVERAWGIFKAHRWPRLSFTDCTSSAIMTTHRIEEVFTFDEDFRKLGHDMLPAPKPLLTPRRPAASPSRRRAPGRRPPSA